MSDREDDRRTPDGASQAPAGARSTPDELDDPDAPASAEEIAASQRLRDALEGNSPVVSPKAPEIVLALSLRAAWDPSALSTDENRAVVDATPSAEEQDIATRLRDALAEKRDPRAGDPADVHLARALRCAFAPPSIDEAEHRAIVDAALAKMAGAKDGKQGKHAERGKSANVVDLASRRRGTVVRVAFGIVTGGLALAASIVFVVTSTPMHGEAPLARARTTQPLFTEPFKPGETSARIDRIASARASDFRDNRFTKWGVR